MRVLIACEFSGTVREAFAARGHDAWSCDLLPTERPGQHYQGDVLKHLNGGWDLMIAHPPCTYLSVSGLHWNKKRPERVLKTEAALAFVQALLNAPIPRIALENPVSCISTRIRKPDQVIQPWMFGEDASKATCFWLKGIKPLTPTKIIPPAGWKAVKFVTDCIECDCCGEMYCTDCQTHYVDCICPGPTQDDLFDYCLVNGYQFARPLGGKGKPIWSNQTPGGQNKLGPSPDRWKLRSKTYEGIAQAMASQWTVAQSKTVAA